MKDLIFDDVIQFAHLSDPLLIIDKYQNGANSGRVSLLVLMLNARFLIFSLVLFLNY